MLSRTDKELSDLEHINYISFTDSSIELGHRLAISLRISILLCLLLSLGLPNLSNADNTQDKVSILKNDWTSQLVLAEIAKHLLEQKGYHVKFVNSNIRQQWPLLKREVANVQIEVWEGTMAKELEKALKKGHVVYAGDHPVKTREEWWYPEYVEKLCPGLPHWRALLVCSNLFLHPATRPKARYLGGPWDKYDESKIRALGLNFQLIKSKNSDQLWKEVDRYISRQEPIIFFNWTPNWVEARIKGKFVEFPEYAPECISDPSWGINTKYPWDCGNPKAGWLKKVVSSSIPKRAPCAFEIIQKFEFTNNMISELVAMVDVDKKDIVFAKSWWLETNQKLWKNWISGEKCQARQANLAVDTDS